MRKAGRARGSAPDGITTFLWVLLGGLVIVWLMTVPPGTFVATFVPSGAMAALMGVFLAVAMTRRPD